jgi:photosystem II stability/assembly factor-like uncharacterized protein
MTRRARPAPRRESRRRTQALDEDAARPRWFGAVTWIAIAIVAAGLGLWLAKTQAEAPAEQVAPPPSGLPHTPDYHALLVSPNDARHIVLGTHAGLYESSDGGRRWRTGELAGEDAMNLVRTGTGTVWAAGHNVLFRSTDDGRSWAEARPSGLPGLDLHGFAADPRDAGTLYAAVAGEGLYRSTDGGLTFELVSEDVGPNVFGLAITPAGRILAADPKRGVYASDDGGRTWTVVLKEPAIGVAVSPSRPRSVLATGSGIFLSGDGGTRWRRVFTVEGGAGPVAWAPSDPRVAYAIGGERLLFRSTDAGRSWRAVP